ncbi:MULTISPECIES: putative immunity protein [Actinomadura]|nr:hypothetical protein [Actinomadura madurae]URN00550.1 hypothetical protein LUW76_43090 [Actinomadura madurae]URN02706.1 hypothetical protein LUW74_04575 [Actinomadura madurae]
MTMSEPGITLTDEDRRAVGRWAADCAERVLPLFEARAPGDSRPREAIAGIRAYAHGDMRKGPLRPLASAALAAAREAGDPVATAAARAAAYAAASPYVHDLVSSQQVNHVFATALRQAQARELAAGGDPGAGDEEIRWAVEHASPEVRAVVRRFPSGGHVRTRLGALHRRLDAGLRVSPPR